MRSIVLAIAFILSLTKIFGQVNGSNLQITRLTGDFYIYTTYNLYQGDRIPANGMYLVTSRGVVLFDSPWDTTQFQPLLDSIKLRHNQAVVLCIPTHFHDDRTAGLEFFRHQGIKTYSTVLTDELSKKTNKKRAEFLITKDTVFSIGNYSFETYYPGQGHTADNIIIWFGKQKVLYGSCLIKSVDDNDLGYLGDANKAEYAATIRKVQAKCQQPEYVIVGHGDWTNVKSLDHTLIMAEELKKKKY
ncbi:BlaB/IND/MUS family subclass B1 metallo-beta-lactamase [Flavihumibacter fluvii]|uniref:BlaB/IND/MUS family subclass B1 metallo-beta-lactamase n=1 Tax=Flavihumibacter fluvii TaxID=2838157 RepID=UPI001BDE0163|nr:BlaB/IND/MUS family subclass B1 metallo-beta-lactamase [Flavihumibacter fluvii]ULQ50749.1 BlaB/IND/MUS family subclass B1 metallo-beta-lactamase [Flavihumibacter fluvii]